MTAPPLTSEQAFVYVQGLSQLLRQPTRLPSTPAAAQELLAPLTDAQLLQSWSVANEPPRWLFHRCLEGLALPMVQAILERCPQAWTVTPPPDPKRLTLALEQAALALPGAPSESIQRQHRLERVLEQWTHVLDLGLPLSDAMGSHWARQSLMVLRGAWPHDASATPICQWLGALKDHGWRGQTLSDALQSNPDNALQGAVLALLWYNEPIHPWMVDVLTEVAQATEELCASAGGPSKALIAHFDLMDALPTLDEIIARDRSRRLNAFLADPGSSRPRPRI